MILYCKLSAHQYENLLMRRSNTLFNMLQHRLADTVYARLMLRGTGTRTLSSCFTKINSSFTLYLVLCCCFLGRLDQMSDDVSDLPSPWRAYVQGLISVTDYELSVKSLELRKPHKI